MKKISTVVVVCIISTHLMGQTKTKRQPPPPPEPPVEMTAPAPPLPPPPPPAPPVPKVINDVEITSIANVPVPPPPPPVPPTLPYRKANERGYSMNIKTINEKTTIKVKKGGFSEMIPLEKWEANKAFYEKRYGKLPPPPPPVPVVEEVNFTAPVIEKNKED